MPEKIKLVECPRDAMQGIHEFISTEKKVAYINQLLKVGFDTIDFGSFVSPKAIPQMADTAEVLNQLDLSGSKSKLLAIIGNVRGAEDAVKFERINYLGFPFSISETFQQRNINSSITESVDRVKEIKQLCDDNGKQLMIYISMGFGNPYGDPWSAEVAAEWVEKMVQLNIKYISLADTIGIANPESIEYLFSYLIPKFPAVEFGAHLHTTPDAWLEKIDAAYKSGCRRFDGAIKGFGGCPMAADDLTGNMATENIIQYFRHEDIELNINLKEFRESVRKALLTFPV
ncbi:MAG: hydroxymethylglutaryl-CoA lyase [Bacteroidetes bacterium]|jgi:hydroxymethylglutaryl-CoA lyase|nr:hydroxymethylglutaryl-CoA lyase [Bacteroidota bacterium]MBK7567829.1 hydroxymethylglutaryl-CoA lyase [Bacteroidota bacterium]